MIQKKRHIAKAISYRAVAILSTFVVSFGITGKVEYGLTIGGIDGLIKLFLYYGHERMWYKTKFGVMETNERSKNRI